MGVNLPALVGVSLVVISIKLIDRSTFVHDLPVVDREISAITVKPVDFGVILFGVSTSSSQGDLRHTVGGFDHWEPIFVDIGGHLGLFGNLRCCLGSGTLVIRDSTRGARDVLCVGRSFDRSAAAGPFGTLVVLGALALHDALGPLGGGTALVRYVAAYPTVVAKL